MQAGGEQRSCSSPQASRDHHPPYSPHCFSYRCTVKLNGVELHLRRGKAISGRLKPMGAQHRCLISTQAQFPSSVQPTQRARGTRILIFIFFKGFVAGWGRRQKLCNPGAVRCLRRKCRKGCLKSRGALRKPDSIAEEAQARAARAH